MSSCLQIRTIYLTSIRTFLPHDAFLYGLTKNYLLSDLLRLRTDFVFRLACAIAINQAINFADQEGVFGLCLVQ